MKQKLLQHPSKVMILLILVVIKSLLTVANIAIIAFAIDGLVALNAWQFVGALAIRFAMKGILSYSEFLFSVRQEKFIQLVNTELREEIAEKLRKANYMEITKREFPEYVSWMTNDMERISSLGLPLFFTITESVLTVLLSIGVILTYHWSILLFLVVLISGLLVIPKLFEPHTKKVLESYSATQEKFSSNVQNLLEGYSVFYALNKMDTFKNRVQFESGAVKDSVVRLIRAFMLSGIASGAVNSLGQSLSAILVGYLVVNGVVSIGVMGSIGSFTGVLFGKVSLIAQNLVQYKSVQVYFDKYESILPDEMLQEELELKNSLELKSVEVSVNGKKIVKPTSFTIEKGKKYALVGDSGSGKSTLLHFLAGENNDYSGEVYLDGKELTREQVVQLRSAVHYNPQKNHLFNATVKENITLWDNTKKISLPDELGIQQFCQLDDAVTEHSSQLSGGQRQRISIARALTQSDKILLFDESTASLDMESAARIEKMILSNPELTVIMVTHHFIEKNRNLFDHVIQLEN